MDRQSCVTGVGVLAAWVAATGMAGAAVPDSLVIQGEHIARNQCSVCHEVARNQAVPPILETPGPSFYEISRRPGVNEKDLRRVLSSKHWDLNTLPPIMPNQELSPAEERAVVHYILSLQQR